MYSCHLFLVSSASVRSYHFCPLYPLAYINSHKKDLHDPGNNSDNHDGMITHLEPDILECKVKWALGSITTNKDSGGDGIAVELFQILKDDAVQVLHSICQQIWKTQQWTRTRKGQLLFQSQRKAMPKQVQTTGNYVHFTCYAQNPSS